MNFDLKFYLALILKRLPVMAAIFLLTTTLAVVFAFSLPPKYVSEAQLLAQGAQIQGSLVTTETEERLEIIRQDLLTRANLIDLAQKFSVFAGEGRMTPDEVVEEMRAASSIRIQGRRGAGATFVDISFTDNRADVAAAVANEFVTKFLAADARWRQTQAGQTLDFFEDEVRRLSEELSLKSAEIVDFETANKDALPHENDFRLTRQAQLQERINAATRDRAALNEQRTRLMALGEAAVDATGRGVALSPQEQRLREAENELASALTRFSESNPRVRLLRAQVDRLREEAQAIPASADPEKAEAPEDVSSLSLRLQLASIDSQIEYLTADIERAEAELVGLADAIARTPAVAIRLGELRREYESLQRLYDAAVASMNQAQSGENIELASKGERLRVVEPAVAPSEPNSPNKRKIAALGMLAGIGLAGLFFVLVELLNRAVRRPQDLVAGLNIQPLATIPYLDTSLSIARRRMVFGLLLIAGLIAIPAGLWAIDTYVMPLDLLFLKIQSRLSL